ncbi:MAG: molybdenum cofactor guanylyltransferase [Vicinamibacterales bacterium]
MTSAAILTGGRARRFDGRDKSQLRVGGRTMLERQLDALRGAVDRIWLAGYQGNEPLTPPLVALADRKPGHGPLAGLDAALAAEPHGAVLLLACDMPNVTGPLLAHLLRQLDDDVDAVVPKTERGYHPLCAVYAQSCRAPVQRRLDHGHLRMQDLLGDLKIRTVDGPELASFGEPDSLLANVNTQAALDALESQQNH